MIISENSSSANKQKFLSIDQKKDCLLSCLEENKADDIVFLDLREKSDITDYMIIVTGLSHTHINSLIGKMVKKLKEYNYFSTKIEGSKDSRWVLLDCNDILIHIFDKETREYYQLEKMWLI